jgi:anaerobic selenocysteine-containing dehydrogenase
LFVVVTDAFMTETAALADVVLPAAIWGEKTGTFTNHDRTVHLSDKAVEPPGDARPDMEIFLDYARRLGVKNRDGDPLIPWQTSEECFDAFKAATAGRPCDYSGLTYDKLRRSGGIQWPCNDEHPDGTARLYTNHRFNTDVDYCEDWGYDLETGAAFERKDFAELAANGRAIFHGAEWSPAHEPPSDEYPLVYTTGRTVYQFHTRTKTGRAPQLDGAAPEAWLDISPQDAEPLGIIDGDLVAVESRRGRLELRARLTPVRPGVVFAPFHYGYWDEREDGGDTHEHARAANELTMTEWDPVSKQPIFKVSAVRVSRLQRNAGEQS